MKLNEVMTTCSMNEDVSRPTTSLQFVITFDRRRQRCECLREWRESVADRARRRPQINKDSTTARWTGIIAAVYIRRRRRRNPSHWMLGRFGISL